MHFLAAMLALDFIEFYFFHQQKSFSAKIEWLHVSCIIHMKLKWNLKLHLFDMNFIPFFMFVL